MKMKDSSSTEIVADEIFSGTWYLVAIPGLMILFTLMVYVVLYLKKRLMKEDPLLENEEGTGKSSMSHSIEIEDDYQAHPNHDKGGDQKHKSSHNH